jgi:hypothetical protein
VDVGDTHPILYETLKTNGIGAIDEEVVDGLNLSFPSLAKRT